MIRRLRMSRAFPRVPRSIQALGLVALVALGYVIAANLVPEPPARAAVKAKVAVAPNSVAAAGPVTGTRQIRAGNSGLCLTVASTSKKKANGAKIQQRACDPRKKTQRFEIVPIQDEGHPFTYEIRAKWAAGWCWATNGGEKSGVTIVQRRCDYGYRQMFVIQCAAPAGRCYMMTRSALNGMCLNIPGASRKQGVTVALYSCRYKKQPNMQFIIS